MPHTHDFSREHTDTLAGALPALAVDRQRIVRCAAFRRLGHKTQAFHTRAGDHLRSRLTHTMEVAHLARCIADALGLRADLAEVVALAHDLGHPPFGHAGERALAACMANAGGFEHNAQSLRVVEYLEHPYPEFRGLNLTRAVRSCLASHSTRYDRADGGGAPSAPARLAPAPESRAVALADRFTYTLHDLADSIHAELIGPADLAALELWRRAFAGAPRPADAELRAGLRPALDRVQGLLMADLVGQFEQSGRVGLSEEVERLTCEVEELLLARVYRSAAVERMDRTAEKTIRVLFDEYVAKPDLLPPRFAERVAAQGAARVVADYIAGMTDRYLLDRYASFLDPTV